MYKPIQLSEPDKQKTPIVETSLNIFTKENVEEEQQNIFTEAVFIGGKETIAPLLADIEVLKIDLENRLKIQRTNNSKKFDPKDYWKSPNWKKLEDDIKQIFGFRFVEVNPYVEKYNSSKDIFESKEMNCCVYKSDRYPIDGLVTDKGFYDKSHSLVCSIYISLGLMHELTSEEILSVFLHEFGHNIDPAVMTVKYAETNILSKYLTDRVAEITDTEKKTIAMKLNPFTKIKNFFTKKITKE